MHIKQALAAYRAQKSRAAKRGIGFLLTFKEWCDWWGEDIDQRGSGHDKLQMQRIADSGPYALGNIRKGYPRDNSKTASIVRQNRQAAKDAAAHEHVLDSMMYCDSSEPDDEVSEDQEFYRQLGFKHRSGPNLGNFAADK